MSKLPRLAAAVAIALIALVAFAAPSGAQVASTDTGAAVTTSNNGSTLTSPDGKASIHIDLGGTKDKPSQGILVIILLTLLSLAAGLILMTTSFTCILIVLCLTEDALSLQGIQPDQELVEL